jgi:molybdate transport system substrate-binding protein
MRNRLSRLAAALAALLPLAPNAAADAAEVRALAAGGIGPVLNQLVELFAQASGHRLKVTIVSGSKTKEAFGTGEDFDVIVSLPSDIDALIAEDRLDGATRADIARVGLGVAVRAGAPKPDVSSVEAFRRALLAATSVSHSAGASGAHFLQLLDRLGITGEMKPKLRPNPPGARVVDQLASGEAELSVNVTATMMDPRVELAGLLPAELQSYIRFAAGVSRKAKTPEAAAAFITFLASPQTAAIFQAAGMDAAERAASRP